MTERYPVTTNYVKVYNSIEVKLQSVLIHMFTVLFINVFVTWGSHSCDTYNFTDHENHSATFWLSITVLGSAVPWSLDRGNDADSLSNKQGGSEKGMQ